MSFDGIGSLTGTGFVGGGIKVSKTTAKYLAIICLILAGVFCVRGAFSWVRKDYIHAIGWWFAALLYGYGAFDTPVLGWCLVIGTILFMFAQAFPSAAHKLAAQAEAEAEKGNKVLADTLSTLWTVSQDSYNKVVNSLPDSHAPVIAAAVSKTA